jgi:hypothetical protein
MPTFEFAVPLWNPNPSISAYTIAITTDSYLVSSPTPMTPNDFAELPDISGASMNNIVTLFVDSLIKKDSEVKWFSNPLKASSIVKKLTHSFKHSEEHIVEAGWYLSQWRITHLLISAKGFVLHWGFLKYEETKPQISSRFLPAMSRPESPVAELRQITIQPTELSEFDVPFSSNNTAEFANQIRDKRDIEETRLRLALLRIKEQRLSENYFTKYGEEYEDEEDEEDDTTSELH